MKAIALLVLLISTKAQAYSTQELRNDCQTAEFIYTQQKSTDPYESVRSTRCIAYLAGFADSYAVSDYLADKVGVKLNAFCLPKDRDLSVRLVRAVLSQLERQSPNNNASTAMLVASALSNSFPCTDSLESKK